MKEFKGTKGKWEIKKQHRYETTISSGEIRITQSIKL
jgi:hypothetical protein